MAGLDLGSYTAYAISLFILFLALCFDPNRESNKLRHIPTVGFEFPFLTYFTAFKYIFYAKSMLEEGYIRHKGGAYKIATFRGWMVLLTTPEQINAVAKASDDVMSFSDASSQLLQMNHIFGENVTTNPYHIPMLRTHLSRRLNTILPEVEDELHAIFSDSIDPKLSENEWAEFKCLKFAAKLACRTTCRSFVGLPLCRNEEYNRLSSFSSLVEVIKTAHLLLIVPEPIRTLVAYLCGTRQPNCVNQCAKHLRPLIEEHRKNVEQDGPDYPDQPNTFLTWLIDTAQGEEQSIENLTKRILLLNFASVHSSSMVLTHALYRLASSPKLVSVLRREAQAISGTGQFSRASLFQMRKMDSFLRESQRLCNLGHVSLLRTAREPFLLPDGTFIPVGTTVNAPATAIHHDEENYPDADKFEAFRFLERDGEDDGDEARERPRFVNTSDKYLSFGHGHNACPGRLYAASSLKLTLASILCRYELRLNMQSSSSTVEDAEEEFIPKDWDFSECRMPNPRATILLKRLDA